MTTTITPTPIQAAKAERDRKHAEAQAAYSETINEANAEFVAQLRRELADRPVTHVANELGVQRQNIHDLLRRYPAAA